MIAYYVAAAIYWLACAGLYAGRAMRRDRSRDSGDACMIGIIFGPVALTIQTFRLMADPEGCD